VAKDYLRYRLTGELLTDRTEAGGAALLDWERLDWAVERLEWGRYFVVHTASASASLPIWLEALRPELVHAWVLHPM